MAPLSASASTQSIRVHPESRHSQKDQRDDHADIVQQAVLLDGAGDAQRDAHQPRHQGAQYGQLHRDREAAADRWEYMILPVLSEGLGCVAGILRTTRSNMLEVIRQDC